MARIFQNDIGTKVRLDAGTNISAATSLKIKYKKPDGTTGLWTATLDGTNYAYYYTIMGDLDQTGRWEVQLYVVSPGWTGYGEITTFEVIGPLS